MKKKIVFFLLHAATSGKKKRAFFLLYAATFGWIGAHRYYVGPVWLAVIYTLLCWTQITFIAALIEIIICSRKSDEEFDAIYNKKRDL